MADETVSRLTAREFYTEWTKTHPGYSNLEFAEAYAAHFLEAYGKVHLDMLNERNSLLRRAAELLRVVDAYWAHNGPSGEQYDEFDKQRAEWYKDAGVEEK